MSVRVFLPTLIALVGLSAVPSVSAWAQPVRYAQECVTNVENATVHVPARAAPALPGGAQLAGGDTLAVYTEDGTCAGYGVWSSETGTTLAAAGSDSIAASPDGYAAGAALRFEAFDASANEAIGLGPAAAYVPCDSLGVPVCGTGTYQDGTFHEVAAFEGAAPSRTLVLADGWTFLSLPVDVDQSFGALLPGCSSGFVYEPGAGYTAIADDASLPAGRGTVLNCAADTLTVTGTPSSTVAVEEGWNLVGTGADTLVAAAVDTTPAGVLASSFFRRPAGEGYTVALQLVPGEAYWVKAVAAGTLQVAGTAVPPQTASRNAVGAGPPLEGASRLTIADARGRTATLWLKDELGAAARRRADLPPVPPPGLFDVRFAGGRWAAALPRTPPGPDRPGTATQQVRLQGAAFPVSVRLEPGSPLRRVAVTAGEQTALLSEAQPSVALRQTTDQFLVAAGAVPQAFRLGTAFPHPVRNRAQFTYAVPEATDVRIEMYDVLGRRVATLVDDQRPAGVYRARIDADRFASGTYFVRMQAGGVQKARRLSIAR